jgi:hypothetical protein
LKRVDVKFKDEDKALMLLNSFPTSSTYENLVTTLIWGKETLELEDVTGAQLPFHQNNKNIDENSQGKGLVVKGNYEHGRSNNRGDLKGKNSRSKFRRRNDINCYKCGKKRHTKRDCPDRKKNKDINGAHYKITDTANIRIKMFDGVVKMLCDVRHVPEVEKNLISYGTLNSNGYGYKSVGRVMKVTKGVMIVMKGQIISTNIYKLLGSTLVGGVTFVESKSDCIILLHMRLDHMNE